MRHNVRSAPSPLGVIWQGGLRMSTFADGLALALLLKLTVFALMAHHYGVDVGPISDLLTRASL